MRRALLIVFFSLLFPAAVAACGEHEHHASSGLPVEALVITGESGIHPFIVEIANTPESLMQGLMFRSSMAEDNGMLFLFNKEIERNFWMKNTHIPLDIVFIKSDGTINHIHENAIPLDETPLPSKGPVLNVLEINGGLASKLGIKAGDKVFWGQGGKKLEN